MDNETNIPIEEQTGRLQQPAVSEWRDFHTPPAIGDTVELLFIDGSIEGPEKWCSRGIDPRHNDWPIKWRHAVR